jgi:hypothetical protein
LYSKPFLTPLDGGLPLLFERYIFNALTPVAGGSQVQNGLRSECGLEDGTMDISELDFEAGH